MGSSYAEKSTVMAEKLLFVEFPLFLPRLHSNSCRTKNSMHLALTSQLKLAGANSA